MPKDLDPRFDPIIDRRGTHCMKWDLMEPLYGVSPDDGLAMWVADMDFRPPDCVLQSVRDLTDHGVIGYFGNDGPYRDAIRWWMQERHGWEVDRDAIFTTHGLVNGTALCVDTWTAPGDGVALFTPVYHAFAKVIKANGRRIVECELAYDGTRYTPDFEAWDQVIEREGPKMAILCSPHNPNGRVWTKAELEGFAALAQRHDLILVSDEIHHDLVFPGHTHIPMSRVMDADRLVMMTAPTKTFNIAGAHSGNVIVEDEGLRTAFAQRMLGLGLSPNSFGLHMTTAAYSPEGAEWVDALVGYLDGNRRLFDEGVNAIPGLRSVPLEATYLSWVDFSGTGMERAEFTKRVEKDARLAVNHGPTFGKGGDAFLRFNIATPRSNVEAAVDRLSRAFGDLQ
ncbi:MalY/PatB family protein [Jannaschia aquimarina]|uniref:cysteine-S-conjugate beta-lyase n=1 Tax=Jannaschia aquimarina TaxID=935700 RepID=A0A0D1D2D9_9RHOB|nr:MalY/PatB family protein [Jannaschia aquimarina]KIT14273.1 Cystathionine beta-lyase PatB [Jannaschia aquimarina]SNS49730.1 cystathione beta-lyase [Jannaschia aquimarina]